MNILQALCLGVLQGITEFLPVSSSGHLVLVQHLFGFRESQLFFDVAVHAGTLLAVLLVFRADLLHIFKGCFGLLSSRHPSQLTPDTTAPGDGVRMAVMILIGSIPTALIGLLFRDLFDRLFTSPAIVGLGLWITGAVLVWSRWSRQYRETLDTPGVLDSLLIGLAQGAAISPGLSRSGVTITAGLLLGLRPELAFRYSFLLSIPAILGALAIEAYHVGGNHPGWDVVAVGFFAAFLVGWLALRVLRSVVGRGKLYYFAPYCFAVGTIAFIVAL